MTNIVENKVTLTGTVASEKPASLMRKLCKHWSHKLEVQYDEVRGEVNFGTGSCELDASQSGVLAIRVNAPDPETAGRLREVVERHLERFAVHETLTFQWSAIENS
ncbi:MAG TPA: DUF2218 domain-containing protein [Chloroflexia bacterium]|nr:DUF2218 domain-containing protein [Chloroflexia bacterium]